MNIIRDFEPLLRARLSKFEPLIQILVGPRQVGKSTAARAFAAENPGKALYLALDNPPPNAQDAVRFVWQRARNIPGHKILILDEIQNVDEWPALIKELYDQDRPKRELSLLLLGSSALDLALHGEESLTGRFEIIRAHHWNAFELNKAFGWNLDMYLKFGGYPVLGEIVKEDTVAERQRAQSFIRDAILEPVITRDILALKPSINSALLRQTLEVCLAVPSQEISFAKILGQLSDRGNSSTIKSYLELLEKAFLIRLLYRYAGSQIRIRTSTPKIVPLSPVLCHGYTSPGRVSEDLVWAGRVFESAVISRLSCLDAQLYYWSNSRVDVDVVVKVGKAVFGLEIKSNSSHDWRGLRAFKAQFPEAKIATIDRETGESLLAAERIEDWFEDFKRQVI